MARTARVIVPGYAHHVLQRGNRRQDTFFSDEDRANYLKILKEQCGLYGVKVWAYCLMTNHVHLIVVPAHNDSLAKAICETHKCYTRMINFKKGWRGYLWQGRFKSAVKDEKYLYAAVRYVECNPVRAGIVEQAEDYEWACARAHVHNKNDDLLTRFYFQGTMVNWKCVPELQLSCRHYVLHMLDFIQKGRLRYGVH